ncbi:hypothetical protein Tco_0947095, partial [Tanacetum coccineum]
KSTGKSAHAEEQMHTAKDTEDQPYKDTSQLPDWFQKPARPPTPNRDWNKTLLAAHGPLKVDTLTPELLTGPTFELMKGSCKSLVELEYFLEEVYKATTDQLDWINPEVIPFDHFINKDLAYLSGGVSSRKYTTSVMKTKAADYGHIKWIEDLITVRRDDDKLYKFKEGDLKRLCIQDIEDMLLLLVQGKLTNLTIEERLAFNVSLRTPSF